MTVNVHIGLVVGSERAGDVVQGGAEFRLDRIAVGIERDALWHVQKQLVALADDLDIGPGRLFAKFLFLLVHIRSEEHTSELQSLMRISYAVFCLKKKNIQTIKTLH